jgi:hypothetical protein
MKMLHLLALSPALLGVAPANIDTAPVPMFTHVPQVKQLFCGRARGSGFYTGPNALTSANHVTEKLNCVTDDNQPIEVTYADPAKDFSSARVAATEQRPLEIDCRGIVEGRQYIAVGYAHGATIQRAIVAGYSANVIPGIKWGEYSTMIGTERFIPGMSGAPVFDAETGAVVGIVKGYNTIPGISYALDISKTPLCANG